jgi:dTMP kinase
MSWFVLDGPDGCGKSSQAQSLAAFVERRGRAVLHVREPGSTPVGEALRQLLLGKHTGHLEPITEALLFSAARAELVHKVVAPALARGEVVIAERGYLSTVVYQGLAAGPELPAEWLFALTQQVHGSRLPTAIFVLDVPPEVAATRRRHRTDDRIEARGADYHARVRDGFLRAAKSEPRAQVIDAARPFGAVRADLEARVDALLR